MTATYVVVGAGQAGGWAAVTMRREGFDGRIVVVGDEPHPPYERPPLSKAVLTAGEELPIQTFHAGEVYERHGIELFLGVGAAAVHPAEHRVSLVDGTSLAYDRLLIATGGRARRLSVPGGELAFAVRSHADAPAAARCLSSAAAASCASAAGVIGLECASSARALGCEVTVVGSGTRADDARAAGRACGQASDGARACRGGVPARHRRDGDRARRERIVRPVQRRHRPALRLRRGRNRHGAEHRPRCRRRDLS